MNERQGNQVERRQKSVVEKGCAVTCSPKYDSKEKKKRENDPGGCNKE